MKKFTFDFGTFSQREKEDLLEFSIAWMAWVDAGAPGDSKFKFRRNAGLCFSASVWGAFSGRNDSFEMTSVSLRKIFGAQMAKGEIRSVQFPFDQPSYEIGEEYLREAAANCCHENEFRLSWIRQLRSALEKELA